MFSIFKSRCTTLCSCRYLTATQMSFIDQLEVVDQHAFLLNMCGEGGGRTGGHAADIGVVAAGGHVELDLVAVEDGCDHSDVRQVGAAIVGRVEHEDVARLHLALVKLDDGLNGSIH